MNFYNVNTTEYQQSSEFKDIMSFVHDLRLERLNKLTAKYPGFTVKHRIQSESTEYIGSQFYYMTHFNVPFYESFLCESLLHKDGNGYLELNDFAFQLNVYCKKIFHRKFWSDWNTGERDEFLYYVYELWHKHQRGGEFDYFQSLAQSEFDRAGSLFEYFKSFVYNESHQFVTLDEVRELFDQLVDKGIWLKRDGDLYQVYENVDYAEQQDMDVKVIYHAGKISRIDELHMRSVAKQRIPVFNSLTSKLNFYPVDDPEQRFEGFWHSPKLGGKVWFVPQFLIFFTPQ
jgi:hypothetical protein